jgi:hypothetical protein
MDLPSALNYALNQISGVSTNSFQVAPTSGAGSVTAGSQIRFLLPSVGMLDFKTTKISFSVKTTGNGARLPAYIGNLFQRIQVQAGGVTISQGSSHNGVLETLRHKVGDKKPDYVCGHPEVLTGFALDGGALADDAAETYHAGLGLHSRIFSIDLGEIAGISPRVVDLALLPQIEIILTVAPNYVLSSVKGVAGRADNKMCTANTAASSAAFEILRPTLDCNMYSLMGGAYSAAVASRIQDVGFVQFCYSNNLVFNQVFNGSARFNVAAMSLKRLSAAFRRTKATTVGGAIPIAGSSKGGTGGAIFDYLGGAGTDRYESAVNQFKYPAQKPSQADDGSENVNGAAWNYTEVDNDLALQWKINSAMLPQYACDANECIEMTKWAWNKETLPSKSLCQSLYNDFVFAVPLELPHNEWEKKTISGLNSMGTNSYVELVATGGNVDTSNFEVFVFAECDTILRAGANKAIEVIS